ncbi:DUF3365 domain-containing protein [Planctomycetales bacterium ZRK34]|nr:DUF3365 domain-containing protein [Planctomycetales bacterium ZRK34]
MIRCTLGAGLLMLAACGDGSSTTAGGWKQADESKLTAAQKLQRDIAVDAQIAMGKQLMKKLNTTLATQGPAETINVCKLEAPDIAQGVSITESLAIGRTSFKLRNPANAPPPWASAYVKQRVEQPTFLTNHDGRFAALLPIRMQAICLNCHGDRDKLAPNVTAALASQYPQDQATGFALDDLRGWFWVEVPAQ